jgi:predicted lipid-binding transport protein (Tim44 family)
MKVLIAGIAVVLGLVGLLMTGCGAIFSVTAGGGMQGILILSVPATLIGLVTLYGAWKLLRSQYPREIPQDIPKE